MSINLSDKQNKLSMKLEDLSERNDVKSKVRDEQNWVKIDEIVKLVIDDNIEYNYYVTDYNDIQSLT